MRLGSQQLRLLVILSALERRMIVGTRVSDSLARRGLVEATGDDGDGFFAITPDGLRALADAMAAGRVVRERVDVGLGRLLCDGVAL